MSERARSSYEIQIDILDEARGGKRKTQISFGARLNYSLTGRYLENLTKAGLLEKREKLYYTTKKGETFLRLMAQINSMVKVEV